MKINVHAHVHPLRSIFEPELLAILWRRLGKEKVPKSIIKLMQKVLADAPITSREELSALILKQFSLDDELKKILKGINESLADDNVALVIEGDMGSVVSTSFSSLLRKVLDTSKQSDGLEDAYRKNGADFFRFLMRGLSPSIEDLTEDTMQELDDEDALVALMMDICSEGQDDDALFEKQIADTSAQVLRYPGRLFPFVKFNPKRKNAFKLVKKALQEQGCVGVKLYPGLGYWVTTNDADARNLDTSAANPLTPESYERHREQFKKLYAFCDANDAPLLLHCNHGGFIEADKNMEFADPNQWYGILDTYQKLKVCFGHFGDESNFVSQSGPKPDSYTARILNLMDAFPGRVFADLSFHVAQLASGTKEKTYFENLKSWLGKPEYKEQILFGTDSFLVQKRMREETYWRYYRKKMRDYWGTDDAFEAVASANPSKFLNLPHGGVAAGKNLKRYVEFLESSKKKVSGHAASWLLEYIRDDASFKGLGRQLKFYLKGWNEENPVHLGLWLFLKRGGYLKKLEFKESGDYRIANFDFLRAGTMDQHIREASSTAFAIELGELLLNENLKPNLRLTTSQSKYQSEIRDYLLVKGGDLSAFSRKLQNYYTIA